MFNNVAFDVVIGMVLVYLLYSLLVTIVGEMLSTWMALRSRILRVAIEKMLNDGYLNTAGQNRYNNWWHFAQRFFLKEFEGFKDSFAGRFYQQASIKYLSNKVSEKVTYFSQTKPSYISDTNFAHTLTAMLTEKGMGATTMDKVNYCLTHNICHIQPQTLAHFQRLATEAGTDVELFATKLKGWFNETNDRATGWYKRKLQLILFWLGFVIAVAFNVDSIQIARFLAKDKDARTNLANMAVATANDSLRYQAILNDTGDSLLPKTTLDSSMALVKSDIKQAGLILGLGWGLDTMTKKGKICVTQKDDGEVYKQLLRNDSLKNDTITLQRYGRVERFVDSVQQKLAKGRKKLEGLLAFVNNVTAKQVLPKSVDSVAQTLDSNKRVVIMDSMELALKNDSLADIKSLLAGARNQLRQLTARQLVAIDSIDTSQKDKGKLVVHGRTTYNIFDKIGYVICQLPQSGSRLIGFIITALMLSLGAPFWFDLLKKLVALRGAGVKPEEKKPVTGRQETVNSADADNLPLFRAALADANQSADASELALEHMTQQLKHEGAVVAIGLKPLPNTNPPQMVVEVMAKDAAAMATLQKKYGTSVSVAGVNTAVVYTTAAMNVFHGAKIGSEIGNQSKVLGQGTLGSFLQKKGDNGKYLVSCWHVLKDNTQWNLAPLQKNIVQNNTVIGRVVEGCLTNTIDVGIATYTLPTIDKNDNMNITGQQREVLAFDSAMSTPVKLFGKVCGFKEAVIIHHKINAQLKYPDQLMHSMVDLFSIAMADSSTGDLKAPTNSGDSGAVVTDMDGLPLGMIIGGNDTLSYAVKFTNIFSPATPYAEYSFITNA